MTQSDPTPRLFRSERIGQALTSFLSASVVSRGVGLARNLYLARIMAGAEHWGLLQIALLVVNLLNPLCCLGLNDSLQRYVPLHETRGTLHRLLRLALPLVLIIAAVLCGVVLLFARPLGDLLFTALNADSAPTQAGSNAGLMRVAALTAFGLIAFVFVFATLKGLRMYRAAGLAELAHNLTFTILAIGLCKLIPGQASPVVGCYAVASLGMFLVMAFPLWQAVGRIEPSPSPIAASADFAPRAVVGQMFRFSLWSALASVTWQILLGYPAWYLNKAAGTKVAAIFLGAQLLAQGVLLIANSIATVIETAVTKTWEAEGPAEADKNLLLAYKATTLFLLSCGVVGAALAPILLRLLPAQFAAGVPIFRLLVLFFLLAAHLLFLGIHFHLIERTRHVFVPWLLGVLGHVLFSAWLVRPGLTASEAQQAAAWAGVGGMSLALAAALALVVAERRPIDRGLWLLIAASFVLAIPNPWLPLASLAAILALAAATPAILTRQQKQHLHAHWTAGREKLISLISRPDPKNK